jgi:methylated-DNA-[protein]-cysteine S-methyltransferase
MNATETESPIFARRVVRSPIGPLTLYANEHALVGLYFEQHKPAPRVTRSRDGASAILDRTEAELDRYFTTREHRFDVPIALAGTDLERSVWSMLRAIPIGRTRAYGEIAAALDRPNASRAIGAAVGRNPISIIVPCHRVIAKSGLLTGYAGGIERKAWLLAHEATATAGSQSRRAPA